MSTACKAFVDCDHRGGPGWDIYAGGGPMLPDVLASLTSLTRLVSALLPTATHVCLLGRHRLDDMQIQCRYNADINRPNVCHQ